MIDQKYLLILLVMYLCTSQNTYSQSSTFSALKYKNDKGEILNYRLLTPDATPGQKYPLVIFMHGSGERGDDNNSQLKWGVKNFATDENMKQYPAFVIAPQCPKELRWGNFTGPRDQMKLDSSPSKPMALLIELIHEFMKDHPVDIDRVYITGLSMGGFGTFDAITRHPDLFAAAVPVCGGGDTSKASTIAHIPIWIFTGANDKVVDPTLSRDMVKALSDEGSRPGFTQYPEVGHNSWIQAYSDPMMMEWLFRQVR